MVRWLSVDDMAGYLGVRRETVYRWISSKGLPAHKAGKLWLLRQDEVDAWVRHSGYAGQQELQVPLPDAPALRRHDDAGFGQDEPEVGSSAMARESVAWHARSQVMFARAAPKEPDIGRASCPLVGAGIVRVVLLDIVAARGSGDLAPVGAAAAALRTSISAVAACLVGNHTDTGIDAKWLQTVDLGVIADGVEGALDDGSAAGAILVGIASVLAGAPVRSHLAVAAGVAGSGLLLPVGQIAARVRAAREAGQREILVAEENSAEARQALADADTDLRVSTAATCAQLVRYSLSAARMRFSMVKKLAGAGQGQLDLLPDDS